MRFVIVTGMSGAGKKTAMRILEDMGYFCADNLPIPLVDKFAQLAANSGQEYSKLALGIDVRSIHQKAEVENLLRVLDEAGYPYEILFLEAGDSTLIKRYKETRRNHPLAQSGRLGDGIDREREILSLMKARADYIIDTSQLLVRELLAEMDKIFVQSREFRNLYITVLSFGFKYGIPVDADLVFDVRFLPNPYYEDALRELTGNDPAVQEFVFQNGAAQTFLEKWTDLLDFLIPNYIAEGKNQLVIAVGCTGGKHRSVTMANQLYGSLTGKQEYGVRIEHRDIAR